MNILVWPACTEIGREVARSLSYHREFKVVTADDEIQDVRHAGQRWVLDLVQAIAVHRANLIYPCHDAVLKALVELGPSTFSDYIVWHGVDTTRLCLSKSMTYERLQDVVDCPKRPQKGECYTKPDFGHGGHGGQWYPTVHEGRSQLLADYLLMEYLPGPEYTIDCFSQGGELLWCRTRMREKIVNGVSTKTRRLPYPADSLTVRFNNWAVDINKTLYFDGAWFFQAKERANSTPVLLEVGPRVAGGCALARANGVNLPLLSVYAALSKPVRVLDMNAVQSMERLLSNAFPSKKFVTVWIDVDDTLIQPDGSLNSRLMGLLYDRRYNVKLLTRDGSRLSSFDLPRTYCVKMTPEGQKSDFVRVGDCLIDDSFAEREEVHRATGATVFDVPTALEVFR